MLHVIRRAFRRKRVVLGPGPQGEEYEAVQMERQTQKRRRIFANNLIKKVGHKNFPFLDDPYN